MNREQIIAAIASASNLHHREGRDIFANKMYSLIESGKIQGIQLESADTQKITRENKAMREAINFAISPCLWVQREDDIYQYRGGVWYAEVLKRSLDNGGNDAK